MKYILLSLALSLFSHELFSEEKIESNKDCLEECTDTCFGDSGLDPNCINECQQECMMEAQALTPEEFQNIMKSMSEEDKILFQQFIDMISKSFGSWELSKEYLEIQESLKKYNIGLQISVNINPFKIVNNEEPTVAGSEEPVII